MSPLGPVVPLVRVTSPPGVGAQTDTSGRERHSQGLRYHMFCGLALPVISTANNRGARRPTTTPTALDGAGSSTTTAPWAAEGAGDGALHTEPSASSASPNPALSTSKKAKGTRHRQGSPSSRRQGRAGSAKRKHKQEPTRKTKTRKPSPRNLGKTEAKPASSLTARGAGEAQITSAEAGLAGQEEPEEDRVDEENDVLETQSASSRVVLLGLTEKERQEEMRDAKEARELAEEEECRRAW